MKLKTVTVRLVEHDRLKSLSIVIVLRAIHRIREESIFLCVRSLKKQERIRVVSFELPKCAS